jgi:conjugal transfer mating pair stabilization protein TraG
MEYSIYTYGTGEIISNVLNVLAILCKSDSLFFRPVMTLTASLGAVWMGMRAIWGGNAMAYVQNWLVPTILVFNIMFVPRVSVAVIDQVDSLRRATVVDNVPVGVALVGHVTSHIAQGLTEAIETHLVPAEYEGTRYSNAGPMFAANLMASSRKLVVSDPTLRQNLKNYVDQCYVWPYLYTNITPGREEALNAPDILSFMAANPHDGLGMYWKDGTGTRFLKCSEVSTTLLPAMATENEKAIVRLSAQILPNLPDRSAETLSSKLKTIGESAWHAIARDSSDVHKRVEQQMVINAGREAMDDGIERLGGQRRFPQLLSYSATRGDEQQNTGFLIAGASASKHLPIFQGIMMALLLISFVFVVAYTFLDKELKMWTTWIKMIVWVQSWPVFYGILNSIGLLWLQKASATIGYTFEPGITWQTQTGLADASWDAYCAVQNLFLAVPVISWALITASGHALVSLSERALPALGRSLGGSIVDNTPSFDNQSIHNRSMNSFQMSQQTLGSSFSMGSVTDDGIHRNVVAPDGAQLSQQQLTTGKYSINANEGIQGNISNQLSTEKSTLQSLETAYSQSQQATIHQAYELTKSYAKSSGLSDTATESHTKTRQQDAREAISEAKRLAHQHNVSEETGFSISIGTGELGKTLGIDASYRASASNADLYQSTTEAGKTKEIGKSLSHALTDAANRQASSTEDYATRSSDSLGGSVRNNRDYMDKISAQQTKVERWSQMASISETKGINISESLNDDVYKYVAGKENIAVGSVGRWADKHGMQYKEYAHEYLAGYNRHMTDWVNSANGPIDASTLDTAYRSYIQKVSSNKGLVDGSMMQQVKDTATKEGIGVDKGEALTRKVDSLNTYTKHVVNKGSPDFGSIELDLKNQKGAIEKTYTDLDKLHEEKSNETVAYRAGAKGLREAGDTIADSSRYLAKKGRHKDKD